MGIQRNEIRGTTPLDIKHVNDNFTTLWYDVYGNSKYAQKIKAELDAVAGRVADSEGNISTITQTVNSIESRVSTTEGDINAVEGRVSTAESTITQQATQIAARIETTTYNADKSVIESNISTVTQTANDVRLDFDNQVIGGRNLILDSSQELRNSSVGQYTGGLSPEISTIYYADYNLVPGDVITFKIYLDCTTNTLKGGRARISYYKPDNAYSAIVGNIIGIGEKGYSTVSHTILAGYDRAVLLIQNSNTAVVTTEIVKYKEAKLEKGTTATNWTPHPDELYAGVTSIDKDGINVGVSTSNVNTQIAYDGLKIMDGTTEIASFGEAGAVTPDLQATNITGNIMNTLDSNVTLNVGSGYTYSTITAALASLGRKKILNNASIVINVYGSISDTPQVKGFTGNGAISVLLQNTATINGSILFQDNNVSCYLQSSGTGKSAIMYSGTLTTSVKADNNSYLQIYNLNLYGGTYGFYGGSSGKTYARDIDVSGCTHGFYSMAGHSLSTYNCIGNAATNGIFSRYGATVFTSGTIPIGATTNISVSAAYHAAYGTNTPTASAYSPPAVTPTVFVGTFGPTSIKTYNHDTSTLDTTYGETAAQGKWDGMSYWKDGTLVFGSDIYNYWQGGYNVTVEMRVRRKNSTHGISGGVAPVPYNFSPSEAFNAVARGVWTDWTTVPSSVFGSGGATLKFYSSVLNNGYAIWDACEVKVTVTKDV